MARELPRFYYFANEMIRRVVAPLMRVTVTVEGLGHVPRSGPLIVYMNHTSNFDPPLLGAYLPRTIEMMSKAENFEGGVRTWIVRNYGAFPIRRGEGDLGAIRYALQVLKEGGALLMAPEGTRSVSHQLGEPQSGVALLAVRSGAPLLPVGMTGVEHVASNVRRWQPTRVHLSVGAPFRLVSPTRKPDRATLEAMSEALMERVALQLPPAYRGRFTGLTALQRFIAEGTEGN